MATIWKGGIGPASTERRASELHRAMEIRPAAMAWRRMLGSVVIDAA